MCVPLPLLLPTKPTVGPCLLLRGGGTGLKPPGWKCNYSNPKYMFCARRKHPTHHLSFKAPAVSVCAIVPSLWDLQNAANTAKVYASESMTHSVCHAIE